MAPEFKSEGLEWRSKGPLAVPTSRGSQRERGPTRRRPREVSATEVDRSAPRACDTVSRPFSPASLVVDMDGQRTREKRKSPSVDAEPLKALKARPGPWGTIDSNVLNSALVSRIRGWDEPVEEPVVKMNLFNELKEWTFYSFYYVNRPGRQHSSFTYIYSDSSCTCSLRKYL